MRTPSYFLALTLIASAAIAAACQGGAAEQADGGPALPASDAGVEAEVDAQPPITPSCPEDFLGSGDGCDCGCGELDPDCPTPLVASACEFDNCGSEYQFDPSDPTRCIAKPVPAGWTCSAYAYGEDGVCSCGCGALDDIDCTTPLAAEDCYSGQNGCPEGMNPDPQNPTQCESSPTGWTCNWTDYYDGDCDCGCGVADPSCAPGIHFSQCDYDKCPSGFSVDPNDLSACIDDAPQDGWDCELGMLLDGSCDCGCGTLDPDCAGSSDPATCDTLNCPAGDELQPGSLTECWEICEPLNVSVGNASCTNGGFFSIFNSCSRHLSACSDGNTYEVECTGGDCVCRVNGSCVAHASGSCSLNSTCNWSLTDNT